MNNQYKKKEKDFSEVMYISPTEEALKPFERPRAESFPDAPYMWAYGCTRFHCFRIIEINKVLKKAEAELVCDNLFDIWINGKSVANDVRRLKLTDITEFLKSGENNVHIRAYQSGTDESFSSAITGGIRVYYDDGTSEEFLTDDCFKQVQLVDFWENDEPKGFETETRGREIFDMNVMPHHPIALRRSFYFVRRFNIAKIPDSVIFYSSALGCYEPYINGERIIDAYFMPFCNNYQKEYQRFDITERVKIGENVIGMISGNGTYNCVSWGQLYAKKPEVTGVLEITYKDGEKEYIRTDEKWICAPSPLVDNDIQYGERYDASCEITDWCTSRADMTLFKKVSARKNTEHKKLLLQDYPYIVKAKEYKLKVCRILEDGSPLFDVGVCIAGRAKIILKNPSEGQKIRIRYCERLDEAGQPENGAYEAVYYNNDCKKGGRSEYFMRNTDVYFAKGEEYESYECRFSYTGFRYIWVEGLSSPEQAKDVIAYELHNALPETGNIVTSDSAINKIFSAAKRSWLNNIFNGPTDCPTREKNYWNGDMQIFSHAACWLTDNSRLLSRWTDNGIKMHPGPYAWEDETYVLPITLYKFYGDKGILSARYGEMLSLIEKRKPHGGAVLPETENSHQYCDWLSPKGVTPDKDFFCGCWYCNMLSSVAYVAEVLGDDKKSVELKAMAMVAENEFNKKYLSANGTDYKAGNQCGLVLPLAFKIAPEENRLELAKTLVKYIEKEDYHITTGFIGTRYLFEVLSEYGYADIMCKIIKNEEFPSWLNMLSTGATAMTESWYGEADPDKSVSMSHFSLGAVIGWFFEYLGGIRINESAPRLKHIVIKPIMLKEIGSFAVTYRSLYGEISVEWHFEGDKPVLNYSLPSGITAELPEVK